MEPTELSRDQWLELYRFLLERLEGMEYHDIRRGIETAAAAPIFEQISDEERAATPRKLRDEVGAHVVRPKEPFEVFAAALMVLWTRMVELPAVASAALSNLAKDKKEIEFRVDFAEEYAPRRFDPFRLTDLTLSRSESTEVQEAFRAVGITSKQEG